MRYLYCLLVVLLPVIVSCSNLNENRYKSQCIGKELNIDSLILSSVSQGMESNVERYKIVSYVDSSNCFSCMLRLDERKNFLMSLQKESICNIEYVLVLNTKNKEAIDRLRKIYKFEYSVVLDSLGFFRSKNPYIPNNAYYKTFLLDSNNRILSIGSPLFIDKYRKYYISKFFNRYEV